tara:strand:+ start:848 stop:2593 length:1746 start_codon:yes stop_codon:yes gene_type:complete
MGILRADRITGLGGANAITGSTYFVAGSGTSHGQYLRVEDLDGDFKFGTSDFTIEFWMNTPTVDTSDIGAESSLASMLDHGYGFSENASGAWWVLHHKDATLIWGFNGSNQLTTSSFIKVNTWHHIAVVRTGGNTKIYADGTQVGTVSDGQNYTDALARPLDIGAQTYQTTYRNYEGFISNLRIINGTALYTSAFTPPTTRLTKTSDTVLLTCNSISNILHEETGKIITPNRNTISSSYATARRDTPNTPVGFSTTSDVGSQYGSTFDGFGSFATSTYMVPPGGNTRERNRGRGIFADGDQSKTIEFINIQSLGNAQDFGDSTTDFKQRGSVSSSTRTATAGGFSSPAFTNIIDFITIASTANATDFGDLTLARRGAGSAGNSTRGIYLGGGSPGSTNTIDFITIATAGNASDFGDATAAKQSAAALASPTRAVYGGGQDNTIEFVTIATTGNASDFGDLISGTTEQPAGTSSSTRGLFICGESQPSGTKLNTIQFITIATTGNATDFGDNTFIVRSIAACNNSLRAVYGGGNLAPASATTNALSYVTIATTGNGQDFGDLIGARNLDNCVGSSDSHGGLS